MSATTKPEPTTRQARFAACWPAVLHEIGDYPCHATSLSRTGALLAGDLPVPSVGQVGVTIGSTKGDLALKTQARITRIVGGDVPGEVVIAVEFDPMDERRTATLEKLIARAKEGGGTAAGGAASSSPAASSGNTEKISLAQRAQPDQRASLFKENDPLVFEGLARNPRLSKREIKSLAERPNLLASTLPLLAAHPRARGDELLQVALAAHPAAPLDLAKAIAGGLAPGGVARLLRAPTLSEGLRAHLLRTFPKAGNKTW